MHRRYKFGLATWFFGARLVLACGTLGLGACSSDSASPQPEHVLLIVIDTLRADHVGALGDWAEREIGPSPTPALDGLALRGAVFERAIAQSSWTAPSMVSLMTGRRVAGDRLAVPFNPDADPHADPGELQKSLSERARIPTIATSFRAHGWSTAAFICNDIVSRDNGYGAGFDVFEQHTPYVGFVEPIAEWFERHAHERTFTYLHLNEPHDPYRPPSGVSYPDSWSKLFQEQPPKTDPERLRYYEEQRARFELPAIDEDVVEIELESARYMDDVRFADDRVRLVLEALEAQGLFDKTLIVVTADHGEGLWTRPAFRSGDRGHEQLHDRKQQVPKGQPRPFEPATLWNTLKVTHGNQVNTELTRVPLILAGPGIANLRTERVVENVDIWPTLLELLDFEAPGPLDGQSLLSLLESSSAWRQQKPVAFSATRYNATVLDQEGWQLISPHPLGLCLEGLEPELYDLNNDPEARRNVAGQHRELVDRLSLQLEELQGRALPQNFTAEELDRNQQTLSGLGYLASETEALKRARQSSTQDLLATLRDASALDCLESWYAAQALVERRKDLSAADLETIKSILTKEQPVAVRTELKQLFN